VSESAKEKSASLKRIKETRKASWTKKGPLGGENSRWPPEKKEWEWIWGGKREENVNSRNRQSGEGDCFFRRKKKGEAKKAAKGKVPKRSIILI